MTLARFDWMEDYIDSAVDLHVNYVVDGVSYRLRGHLFDVADDAIWVTILWHPDGNTVIEIPVSTIERTEFVQRSLAQMEDSRWAPGYP